MTARKEKSATLAERYAAKTQELRKEVLRLTKELATAVARVAARDEENEALSKDYWENSAELGKRANTIAEHTVSIARLKKDRDYFVAEWQKELTRAELWAARRNELQKIIDRLSRPWWAKLLEWFSSFAP